MDNQKNKKIYRRWSKLYDKFFGSNYVNAQREMEISMLKLKSGDKVLFIGIGTGEDLKFLPKDVEVVGVDITDEMLDIANRKAEKLALKNIEILKMDGQNLVFEDNSFDVIILNLILSVIPDGHKCLSEAYRVCKGGGKFAVFDKFLDDKLNPNIFRRLLNRITSSLGTDINRRFADILRDIKLSVVSEKNSILGGMYRIIILKK